MNNIYVDELPKSCNDCEFGYFYDCQYCTLRPDLASKNIWVEKEKHCPLLSIKSLKQQVRDDERKKVCKQIYELFTNKEMWGEIRDWWLHNDDCKKLKDVLKAIENKMENQKIIKLYGENANYYFLLNKLKEENNEY